MVGQIILYWTTRLPDDSFKRTKIFISMDQLYFRPTDRRRRKEGVYFPWSCTAKRLPTDLCIHTFWFPSSNKGIHIRSYSRPRCPQTTWGFTWIRYWFTNWSSSVHSTFSKLSISCSFAYWLCGRHRSLHDSFLPILKVTTMLLLLPNLANH